MKGVPALVTRNDVAKLANVSPAVVSYVINNSNYVSEEKRRAVLAAIKELNYIPNQNAINLRQGRTNMIAVIRGSQLNDIFNDLLFYLENAACERGYQVSLLTVTKKKDYYATDDFVDLLISRHFDAIFVANSSLTEKQLNRLVQGRAKVLLYVTRDYHSLDPHISQIIPHYRAGIRKIVNKLIAMGHRRIALFPNLAHPLRQTLPSNHRFSGYMDAFIDHSIPLDYAYIPDFCANLGEVITQLDRMFNPEFTPKPPTAILADEPFVVANIMKSLNARGLRVPEDVSLVCFSNSTLSTITTPALTSIGYEPRHFALTSMDMMESLVKGEESKIRLVPLNYYERGSIAPPHDITPLKEPWFSDNELLF